MRFTENSPWLLTSVAASQQPVDNALIMSLSKCCGGPPDAKKSRQAVRRLQQLRENELMERDLEQGERDHHNAQHREFLKQHAADLPELLELLLDHVDMPMIKLAAIPDIRDPATFEWLVDNLHAVFVQVSSVDHLRYGTDPDPAKSCKRYPLRRRVAVYSARRACCLPVPAPAAGWRGTSSRWRSGSRSSRQRTP